MVVHAVNVVRYVSNLMSPLIGGLTIITEHYIYICAPITLLMSSEFDYIMFWTTHPRKHCRLAFKYFKEHLHSIRNMAKL